jgi:hypothetical protein
MSCFKFPTVDIAACVSSAIDRPAPVWRAFGTEPPGNLHFDGLINTTRLYPNLFADHRHGKYKKGSNV